MHATRIANPDLDPTVSELLELLSVDAESTSGVASDVTRVPDPGTKGPVVEAVMIGIASNAAWELIRYLVRRLRGRAGFDPAATIEVDGDERSLGSLDDEG